MAAVFATGGGPDSVAGEVPMVQLAVAGATHAALVFADGRPPIAGPLPMELAADRLDELEHLWAWSAECPVQRVEPELRESFRCRPAAAFVTVEIRWPGQPRSERPAGSLKAAPPGVWREIEEALLPEWPVSAEGIARVPVVRGEGLRVRFAGENWGSGWHEVPAGASRHALRLEPAASPLVRVLDAAGELSTSASIAVAVPKPSKDDIVAHVRADARGDMQLLGLPATLDLVLFAKGAGSLPLRIRTTVASIPRTIRLAAGCALVGVVESEEAVPLAEVALQAEGFSDRGMLLTADGRTDEQGHFRIGPLPTGPVVVAVHRAGRASATLRLDLTACRGDHHVGRVPLAPATEVGLEVVDDRGEPVAGAEVRSLAGAVAHTDRNGRTVLLGLPTATSTVLSVGAPGHQNAEQTLLPPLPASARVELERSVIVVGRFVGESGVAPTSPEVRVLRGSTFKDEEIGPEGLFEIALRAGTEHEMVFRSASTLEVAHQIAAMTPGTEVDLGDVVAPDGQVVIGRLLREDTAEPVGGARVWAVRGGNGPRAVVAWALGEVVTTTSYEDGSFRLSGLVPGPASLRIEAAGLAPRDLGAVAGGDGDVIDLGNIHLTPGAVVQVVGEVEDGAVAHLDWKGLAREMDLMQASFVAGEAWFHDVPAGPALVSVLAGRRQLCEERVEVPTSGMLEITCDPERLDVRGTVSVAGQPTGPGILSWLSGPNGDSLILNNRSPLGAGQSRIFGSGRPRVEVPVDADGSFASSELAPGDWHVVWRPESGGSARGRQVRLEAIEESSLALDFSPYILDGRVVGAGGEPLAGVRVLDVDGRSAARTDADGRFRLLDLTPGPRRVQARDRNLQSVVLTVEIPPDRLPEPVLLTLEESEKDRIEVRVLTGDGSPTGGFAFVEGEGEGLRLMTLDTAGRSEIRLLPPWPLRVRMAAVAGGCTALGDWVPIETALEEGLEVVCGDGGTLEVVSDEPSDVAVLAPNGWDLSGLYRHLGLRTVVTPEAPLQLGTLPPGRYQVSVGDEVRWADVQGQRPVVVRITP